MIFERLNRDLNGFKFYKAMGDKNTVSLSAPTGFYRVWYGNRSGETSNADNGEVLIDITQGILNYSIIHGTKLSNITYTSGNLTFTFTGNAYWQVNAIGVAGMG